MTEPIRPLNCPSCGSPLPLTDQRRIVCQYCKATLQLPEPSSSGTPQQIIIVTPSFQPNIKTKSIPLWKQWLLGLVIISAIGTCLALGIFFSNDGAFSLKPKLTIWSLDRPILIPNEPYANLVSLASFSDSSYRIVYFDFNQTNPLQWKSEDLEQPTYNLKLQMANGRVYLANQTQLIAFQQSDGAQLWQATLNDLLPTSCSTCLQANSGHVVALTQLHTLQAFDATTGQTLWSAGLSQLPKDLYLLKNHLLYMDEVNNTIHLQIVDAHTGQIEHSLTPTCPNHVFTNDPQTLAANNLLIPSRDEQNLYLLYGFWEPACLEKWDLQTGKRLWQTTLPEELARDQANFLLDDAQLFLSAENGKEIWHIDTNTGQATKLLQDESYQIRPLTTRGGKLVVQAKRTLGSQRYELWTIDLQTGKKLWQTIPNGSPLELNSAEIIGSQNKFAAFPTPAGLTILQAFEKPQRLVFETFNLESGKSNGQMTYAVPEQTIFSITLIGWHKNYIYLEQDGISIFDTNTGQPVIYLP
jgi:outer membrane protein assembly factor BamB